MFGGAEVSLTKVEPALKSTPFNSLKNELLGLSTLQLSCYFLDPFRRWEQISKIQKLNTMYLEHAVYFSTYFYDCFVCKNLSWHFNDVTYLVSTEISQHWPLCGQYRRNVGFHDDNFRLAAMLQWQPSPRYANMISLCVFVFRILVKSW